MSGTIELIAGEWWSHNSFTFYWVIDSAAASMEDRELSALLQEISDENLGFLAMSELLPEQSRELSAWLATQLVPFTVRELPESDAKAARIAAVTELATMAASDGRDWTLERRLSAVGLPRMASEEGPAFTPPEAYNPARPLRRGSRYGFLDVHGNEWEENRLRSVEPTTGWTVTLPRAAVAGAGWRSVHRPSAPEPNPAVSGPGPRLGYFQPVEVRDHAALGGLLLSVPDATELCAVLLEGRVRIFSVAHLEPNGEALSRHDLYDGSFALVDVK